MIHVPRPNNAAAVRKARGRGSCKLLAKQPGAAALLAMLLPSLLHLLDSTQDAQGKGSMQHTLQSAQLKVAVDSCCRADAHCTLHIANSNSNRNSNDSLLLMSLMSCCGAKQHCTRHLTTNTYVRRNTASVRFTLTLTVWSLHCSLPLPMPGRVLGTSTRAAAITARSSALLWRPMLWQLPRPLLPESAPLWRDPRPLWRVARPLWRDGKPPVGRMQPLLWEGNPKPLLRACSTLGLSGNVANSASMYDSKHDSSIPYGAYINGVSRAESRVGGEPPAPAAIIYDSSDPGRSIIVPWVVLILRCCCALNSRSKCIRAMARMSDPFISVALQGEITSRCSLR